MSEPTQRQCYLSLANRCLVTHQGRQGRSEETSGASAVRNKKLTPGASWDKTSHPSNLLLADVLWQARLPVGGKKVRWFQAQPEQRLRYLNRRHDTWARLAPRTRKILSRAPRRVLRTVLEVWQGIEDSLIISSPQILEPCNRRILLRVWRWAVSNAVQTNGRRHTTKMWKALTALVKHRAIQSVSPLPTVPRGTIFVSERGKLNLPVELGLSDIVTYGIRTKEEGTRLMHFVSTRGLPSPSQTEFEEELNSHGARITSHFQTKPEVEGDLRFIGGRIAAICKSWEKGRHTSSVAHLSLSNSASFESSRRKGGRGAGVGELFARWITEISPVTERGTTHFGQPYWLEAGYARFRTMCRKELLPHEDYLRSDLIDELDWLSQTYTNPVQGLDGVTGFQLLQWSIERGLARGRLEGGAYKELGDLRASGTVFPEVRVSPIGEPGGKVRTITVGEDWVTLFLSPFGHELVSWLEYHPHARAGLGAAAQAYEYVKSAGFKPEPEAGTFYLTSDLTQASEMLVRDYTKAILYGFCDALNIGGSYIKTCIELLCGPRYLGGAPAQLCYEYLGCKTTRGCLMGDPGTKAALMLTMVAAEEYALRRYLIPDSIRSEPPKPEWRHFVAAGDDHFARGPREYLELIPRTLELIGAEVSFPKSYLSMIGGFLSEELMVSLPGITWKSEKFLWNRPYGETPHVDSIKIRLLSPCSKVTLDTADESNPAIGKWAYLRRKIEWLPENQGHLKELVRNRFRQRFYSYIDWEDPFTYIDPYFGGLGLPFADPDSVCDQILELDPIVLQAMLVACRADCPYSVRAALYSYRANTTYRGMSLNDMILEQNKFVFRMADDSATEEELRDILQEDPVRWLNMRARDRARLARKAGYLSLSEVMETLLRPTYFKQVLAGESDLIESLPEFHLVNLFEDELEETLLKGDLTLGEYRKINTPFWCGYDHARQVFLAKSWQIQSDTSERIRRGEVHVAPPRLVSYQTTPWKVRRRRMKKLLLRNWPDDLERRRPSPEELWALRDLVKNQASRMGVRPLDYVERVYVRSTRLIDLCTLKTPLVFQSA